MLGARVTPGGGGLCPPGSRGRSSPGLRRGHLAGRRVGRRPDFQGERSYRAGSSGHSQVPGVTLGRGVRKVARAEASARGHGGCGVVTRVPFQGQLPIGLLELLLAGVAPHPQRLVVTLHRPAGRGAQAGARGGAGARARAEVVVVAPVVLACGRSPAPAPGQPASAAAATTARGDGGARRRAAAPAAARGSAEWVLPEAAAPHGLGEDPVPEIAAQEGGGAAAGGRRGLRRTEAGPREAGPRWVSL